MMFTIGMAEIWGLSSTLDLKANAHNARATRGEALAFSTGPKSSGWTATMPQLPAAELLPGWDSLRDGEISSVELKLRQR
jgi:hypothetical protein